MNELETARRWLSDFARDNKCTFSERGEIGFGRECVGILNGQNYVAFCPDNMKTLEKIEGLQFDAIYDAEPEDSYHKDNFLAVLVVNDTDHDAATIQLYGWMKTLSKSYKLSIVEYQTGAVGTQALFSGVTAYALKLEATQ